VSAAEGIEFQNLVEILAITGARYSQAAALQIRDLRDQGDSPKLLVPVSKKGRGQKPVSHHAVAISKTLAAKLRNAAGGRPPGDPLLLQKSGEPWGRNDHLRLFRKSVAAAGLDPSVSSYALRHSSIVRQLLANVPPRTCAACHDTSIKMLEQHYSVFIADHSDALTRAILIDTGQPMQPLAVVRP
jgi:site-specific recombinase XerD